jgi:putative Mg2+ transporter-C (MgtC) family protein
VLQPGRVALDPSRVAAQVISGIGFLGAGTIVVRKQSVHGLTTAASIWTVAGIGMAAGGALYLAATAATLVMLVILALVKPLEDRLLGKGQLDRRTVSLIVTQPFELQAIESHFRQAGVEILGVRVRDGASPGEREIGVTCGPAPASAALRLAGLLKEVAGVREVSST